LKNLIILLKFAEVNPFALNLPDRENPWVADNKGTVQGCNRQTYLSSQDYGHTHPYNGRFWGNSKDLKQKGL